ncbi:MAG: tetraacyldisaccharide 4'-kinase, partial [Tepidisphaeraceae bacterium]
GDHHGFTETDLARLRKTADNNKAEVLVVTEKDWTKLAHMPGSPGIRILRLNVEMAFDDGRGDGLIDLILTRIEKAATFPRHFA